MTNKSAEPHAAPDCHSKGATHAHTHTHTTHHTLHTHPWWHITRTRVANKSARPHAAPDCHHTRTHTAHAPRTHRTHTHTHTHTRGGTSHAHTHTRVTNKSAQPHAAPDCQRKGKCALVLRPAKLRNKNKNHTSSFDITSDKGIDKTDCGGGVQIMYMAVLSDQ